MARKRHDREKGRIPNLQRKEVPTASQAVGDRHRREVQSVTNPAFTQGRQGDNLCGACFVLF